MSKQGLNLHLCKGEWTSCLKCVTPVRWGGEAPFSQIIQEWQQKLFDVELKDKLASARLWPLTLDPMCNRSKPQLSLGEQRTWVEWCGSSHHLRWWRDHMVTHKHSWCDRKNSKDFWSTCPPLRGRSPTIKTKDKPEKYFWFTDFDLCLKVNHKWFGPLCCWTS